MDEFTEESSHEHHHFLCDEETEKKLKDLIENTVKSSMEDSMGKLFKELNDNRDPKFHVDDVKENSIIIVIGNTLNLFKEIDSEKLYYIDLLIMSKNNRKIRDS